MAGAFGRPSAVVQTAAEERLRSDALARRITVADPHPVEAPPPAGQRVIAGYRLARTFSDVVKGRHRIFRVG
ncbi:MAG TPA: hypothetical protein VNE18_05105, partial [Rhodanobacter sp.]|nr:hypothetical protein [Rhodanobacter sp.]